jgi:hypothetical protein
MAVFNFFEQGKKGSRRPRIYPSIKNVPGTIFTKALASLALANLEFEKIAFDFTEYTLKEKD